MPRHQLQNSRISHQEISSSQAALHVMTVDVNGDPTSAGGGSTQVSIKEILSSSGGTLVDSTSVALGVSIRAGAVGVNTSSGGGVEGSTTTPVNGKLGLHVRQVIPTLLSTTAVITSTHSTARYELVSSAANLRHKVFAYFIGSTHTNPSSATFQSSGLGGNAGSDKWTVNFGSGSSGITGANLAVTPPAFLFATAVHEPLTIRVEGGSSVTSTAVVRVSFSYFSEA